ncbi:MAG: NAD+ synthase [Bacteroidetes bacterium]|nr:NAD+ synthase [Bacteroidota bacterium]
MKIALAQQNYHIGNFSANVHKIIEAIAIARDKGADLILFSELAVCGYPPRDFLEFEDFIDKCKEAIEQIKLHTEDIAVLIGAPDRNPDPKGKDLFNAAYFLYKGNTQAVVHKTCLPTYDVFDEYRYFEPAKDWQLIPFKGKKLAVTICEDIWNLGDNPLYTHCPMDQLIGQQPDLMLNLSASPFDYTHVEDRKAILKKNVLRYQIPIVYCNAVGSQTELVFDGGSLVMDKQGDLHKQLPLFKEAIEIVELTEMGTFRGQVIEEVSQLPEQELSPLQLNAGLCTAEIYEALVMGISDYFSKMGFTKAILGSSGGIDSAVTLALAVEALGKEQVQAVLMPSAYSSEHSIQDAVALSKQLGNPYQQIPIEKVYQSFLETLEPSFEGLPFSVAEENLQSRTRGNLLMALANKFGYVLLNTSNKSELATGYGTLYGDMAGGLSVLGDCYKLQVYALARYINREREIIPNSILHKAPSAELRPGQKDSDSLPDYSILDPLLYLYIEKRKSPTELKAMGFEPQLVDRILRLVNTNEYKRNQFCPIIRISPKAFGMGRRLPIVGKYLS